ncbi:hypothetical protein M6B38_414900 [Iris pallida]|uniref:Uncharacterized protein n=1 Tax=Iris pallida TaxID=29817 RepID=A0AAX6FKC8_IRIPA|nr:hypothetical protein M6B38_414900 [Iris pallida]
MASRLSPTVYFLGGSVDEAVAYDGSEWSRDSSIPVRQ